MSYKFDWIKNNVIVIFEGELKYEDIFHADGKIFGDSRFDLMTYAIYDFSKVDNFIINKKDVEIFSELNLSATIWNKRLKLACVTQDKNIIDAFSHFINLMKESKWECRIFSKVEKAFEWIEMKD